MTTAEIRTLIGEFLSARAVSVTVLDEFRDRTFAAVPEVAQVLALAALIVGSASPPPESRHAPETMATLTEAERRVAIAVSGGLSNREAAETLFLSVRTVESHLVSVFRKLGVRNRTELALYW